MKPRPKKLSPRDALRAFAFSLPEAYEDDPWGESVAKVRNKVFVFFGASEDFGLSVKLPDSAGVVLGFPFAEPTGYGLGKAGWVTIKWQPDLPIEMLQSWIVESYRAVAPKRLARAVEPR